MHVRKRVVTSAKAVMRGYAAKVECPKLAAHRMRESLSADIKAAMFSIVDSMEWASGSIGDRSSRVNAGSL